MCLCHPVHGVPCFPSSLRELPVPAGCRRSSRCRRSRSTFTPSLHCSFYELRGFLRLTDFKKVAGSRRKKIEQREQLYQALPRSSAIDGNWIVVESSHESLGSGCRIYPAHGRPIRKSAQVEGASQPRGRRWSAGEKLRGSDQHALCSILKNFSRPGAALETLGDVLGPRAPADALSATKGQRQFLLGTDGRHLVTQERMAPRSQCKRDRSFSGRRPTHQQCASTVNLDASRVNQQKVALGLHGRVEQITVHEPRRGLQRFLRDIDQRLVTGTSHERSAGTSNMSQAPTCNGGRVFRVSL